MLAELAAPGRSGAAGRQNPQPEALAPDSGIELHIELHPRNCSCRGGSWLYSASAKMVARCSSASPEKESVGYSAWKALGKPACLEVYRQALARRS